METRKTPIPTPAILALGTAIVAALLAIAALAGLATVLIDVLCSSECAAAAPAAARPFDVPRIEGIAIDGKTEDWDGGGFRVAALAAPDGRVLPAGDFDARFRVGWDGRGLLVLAEVSDDEPREHEDDDRLWRLDCVEIFIAGKVGDGNRYQLVLAPGADGGEARARLYDHRDAAPADRPLAEPAFASTMRTGGYVIETLLPWENLGLEPRAGLSLALQLVANDGDADGSLRVAWFPSYAAHEDPSKMYAIRLAASPGRHSLLRAVREVRAGRCAVVVLGAPETAGLEAVVSAGGNPMARGRLEIADGRARARLETETPPGAGRWPAMTVSVDGEEIAAWPETPTLGGVLARYLEAVGGRVAVERHRTRAVRGVYLYDLPYAETPRDTLTLAGWSASDDRWLIEVGEGETIQRVGADGAGGWRQTGSDVRPDDDVRRGLMAFVLDPRGPARIERFFPDMVLVGRERRGGADAIAVESRGGARARTLWFDEETGLLGGVGSHLLLDYENADGVLFPRRIRSDRGNGYSAYVFEEVTHDVPVDGVRFAAPEPPAPADLFAGIDDPAVLPMLRRLPFRHGGMNVPAVDGRFLYDLIVRNGYTRGLEIGTSNGYSTLWLGLAFRETGGRVITIEYEPLRAAEAAENFARAGLTAEIDARAADAFEEIPRIEGRLDFVFLDAWKPDYVRFFRLLRDRISPGGVIAAHNAISQEGHMEDFLAAVRADPGFETIVHRTSPAGISVSFRRRKD